jgi:hypothetical protein
MFAPTAAIWLYIPPTSILRSILKPVSLSELSVHERLIWLEDIAVALSPAGAFGG